MDGDIQWHSHLVENSMAGDGTRLNFFFQISLVFIFEIHSISLSIGLLAKSEGMDPKTFYMSALVDMHARLQMDLSGP